MSKEQTRRENEQNDLRQFVASQLDALLTVEDSILVTRHYPEATKDTRVLNVFAKLIQLALTAHDLNHDENEWIARVKNGLQSGLEQLSDKSQLQSKIALLEMCVNYFIKIDRADKALIILKDMAGTQSLGELGNYIYQDFMDQIKFFYFKLEKTEQLQTLNQESETGATYYHLLIYYYLDKKDWKALADLEYEITERMNDNALKPESQIVFSELLSQLYSSIAIGYTLEDWHDEAQNWLNALIDIDLVRWAKTATTCLIISREDPTKFITALRSKCRTANEELLKAKGALGKFSQLDQQKLSWFVYAACLTKLADKMPEALPELIEDAFTMLEENIFDHDFTVEFMGMLAKLKMFDELDDYYAVGNKSPRHQKLVWRQYVSLMWQLNRQVAEEAFAATGTNEERSHLYQTILFEEIRQAGDCKGWQEKIKRLKNLQSQALREKAAMIERGPDGDKITIQIDEQTSISIQVDDDTPLILDRRSDTLLKIGKMAADFNQIETLREIAKDPMLEREDLIELISYCGTRSDL